MTWGAQRFFSLEEFFKGFSFLNNSWCYLLFRTFIYIINYCVRQFSSRLYTICDVLQITSIFPPKQFRWELANLISPPKFDGSNYIYWNGGIRSFLKSLKERVWVSVKKGWTIPSFRVYGLDKPGDLYIWTKDELVECN